MTSARTAQSERIHRECDCRKLWPCCIACAHFGASVVQLDDYGKRYAAAGVRFMLWRTDDQILTDFHSTDDYDAALAAFHEAEARLLAGGAE